MKPRISFQTLGCKLNSSESEALAARFSSAGYRIVPFGEPAEVQIINTCTVTDKADRKSRNTVNRALHKVQDEPLTPSAAQREALVVVTGCFAGAAKTELERDGRTYVVENNRKAHIFDLVEARLAGEIIPLESLPPAQFTYPSQDRIFHTRGMVKIQDGCDNFCSFCIIPFVRGRAVSRPAAHILAESRQMLADGYKELVLTGVNMSRYGLGDGLGDGLDDWAARPPQEANAAATTGSSGPTRGTASGESAADFTSLLAQLVDIPSQREFRVRISSIEPEGFSDRFFELYGRGLAAPGKQLPQAAGLAAQSLVPHLHLCLQAASDRILLAMRRQYSYGEFCEIVARLRGMDPLFNVTTDIIVGFPGEGDEEFAATMRAVEELEFGHVHVFPYSVRSGTRAQRMPGKVEASVIRQRSRELTALAEEVKRRYRGRLLGSTQRVLVERAERVRGGVECTGFGQHYVPVRFLVPGSEAGSLKNSFFSVSLESLDAELVAQGRLLGGKAG